jgi:integrase
VGRRTSGTLASPTSASTISATPARLFLLGGIVHPKLVQELLGHATIVITLDTYSHVLPGMGDQAATAMEDALS